MQLDIVDVFAERPLAGNPLAVVRDAAALPAERMQAMALEMNFSETTFVIREDEHRARVRIFTPTEELPFAGHPTLGTAWVLADGRERFTLELDAGEVPVDFERGIAWIRPPPVRLGARYAAAEVAGWLGLPDDALDPRFAPRQGSVGIDFLFVGLDSPERLERFEPTLETLRALPSFSLFVFCENRGDGDADYGARMFFDAKGLREDPATGSANSVFAAHLAQTRGDDFEATVDQGVAMGRPSRIYLEVRGGAIRVGGRVQPVASGAWRLDA